MFVNLPSPGLQPPHPLRRESARLSYVTVIAHHNSVSKVLSIRLETQDASLDVTFCLLSAVL